MERLLIVDDSIAFLNDLKELFTDAFDVSTASNGQEALDILKRERFSAILLDINLPDLKGTEVLKIVHSEIDPYLPVIIITDYDDVNNVIEAMRHGASDFIPKDINLNVLASKIRKALERRELHLNLDALRNEYLEKQDSFVFVSDAMKKLNYEITRLAKLRVDVLLVGETGVGKDIIASQIYLRSNRFEKPFIPVPIRSLSDTLIESELFGHEKGAFSGADRLKVGKFEAADKGIVYIPEISNLSETIQLKLLQFMQYKTISRVGQDPTKSDIRLDVWLIMATNEHLVDLVAQGKIREDFYHRISGVMLEIPPLRERREDIKPLTDYFIKKYSLLHPAGTCTISVEALNLFYNYHWPGNVRELSNAIKNAIVYTHHTVLSPDDFPNILNVPTKQQTPANGYAPDGSENIPKFREAEQNFKKMYFERLWNESVQDIKKISELSGLTPQAVRRILKQLQLR
jgi:DNA-binding NtrC family response regulator